MNIKVILQSLYYISKKLNKSVDKLTALKLLYFADKYHLMSYGRPVTDDFYWAMKLGPVASNAKEILDFNPLSPIENKTIKKYIVKVGKNKFKAVNKKNQLDHLSETDKDALDFAIEHFGKKYFNNGYKIAEITHIYPEWKKYEKIIDDVNKRIYMPFSDFFSKTNAPNDPFNHFQDELIELSKESYLGFL